MSTPLILTTAEHHRIEAGLKEAGALIESERTLCETVQKCRAWLDANGINWNKEYAAMHRDGENRLSKYHRAERQLQDLRREIVKTLTPIIEPLWAEWWAVTNLHGQRTFSPQEDEIYQRISTSAVWAMESLERLVEPEEYQRLSRMTGEMSDRDIEVFFKAERIEEQPRQLTLMGV